MCVCVKMREERIDAREEGGVGVLKTRGGWNRERRDQETK